MARHFLGIGNNAYDFETSGLRPLKFAESDVGGLARVLREDLGFNVQTLLGTEATKSAVEAALTCGKVNGVPVAPDDLFVLMFAVHGSVTNFDGNYYLHLYGATLEHAGGSMAASYLSSLLHGRAFKALHVLTIYDACRSPTVQLPHSRGAIAAEHELLARDVGAVRSHPTRTVATLYGCAQNEVSYEDPDQLKGGLLSHFLIECARDPEVVSVSDWVSRASRRTWEWSQSRPGGIVQRPWQSGVNYLDAIPIRDRAAVGGRPAPAPKTPVQFPKPAPAKSAPAKPVPAKPGAAKPAPAKPAHPKSAPSKPAGAKPAGAASFAIPRLNDLFGKAQGGDARAAFDLAWALDRDNKKCVHADDSEAARWYRRAAEAGDAAGMCSLGVMYANGRGVGRNDAEAVRWYRRAAGAGHARGMWSLGVLYESGRGVKRDDAEAARWYRRAAEAGYAKGMNDLARMCASGQGVERNEGEALRWYRRAAEAGDAASMCSLGVMYENGRGAVKDDAVAARWYRRAAEAGDAVGMFNLGVMYAHGRGVERDDAEAVRWYRRSAGAGLKDAKDALRRRGL